MRSDANDIAQSPAGILKDNVQLIFFEWWSQTLKHCRQTTLDNFISKLARVSANISQAPDCLINKFIISWMEQANKDWDNPQLHDSLDILCLARSYVGQYPYSFVLDMRVLILPCEFDYSGNNITSHVLIDWGMIRRNDFSESNNGMVNFYDILTKE